MEKKGFVLFDSCQQHYNLGSELYVVLSAHHSLQCFDAVSWATGRAGSIQPVKTLHQNPLAMVVYISRWDTDCSTLWHPHLPVNATEGAIGLPSLSGK